MNNVVVTKVFEERYIFYMLRFKYKAQFKLRLLPSLIFALRCDRLPVCLGRGGGGKRRGAGGVGCVCVWGQLREPIGPQVSTL